MSKRARSKLKVATESAPKGYNPRRGRDYFVASFIVLLISVTASAAGGASISSLGAVAFVIGCSVLAGVVGTFTDKVGF